MNLLDELKKNNLITNTKGSKYYAESYNNNLDVFTKISRYTPDEEIIRLFYNALIEDETLALANLLYILDIRNGKGERRIFKTIFKYLCNNYPSLALQILPHISSLGRYDYILLGLNTKVEKEVINLIKKQLAKDIKSENPSLLAKWLPSHRSHNQTNKQAKLLRKRLHQTEKEYRIMLSNLRKKLNIVEKNLTVKTYDNIDFNRVPSKAMLKYTKAFQKRMPQKYQKYKEEVKVGQSKINTQGLFAYEIVKKIITNSGDDELYDLMWQNQNNFLKDCQTNILVMADTSGSMLSYNAIPYCTSLGLALYTAERNNGIFKNHFLTFSSNPYLCEIKGKTIKEKLKNIPVYIADTDIDKAFELVLKTAKENNLSQNDLPSHILIISDMEFDEGVYTKEGTNFQGWKKAFEEVGYTLPQIIFWNVAGNVQGLPVTKFDNDVAMISSFSTNILENILTLDKYNPVDVMLEKLSKYIEILKKSHQNSVNF